jgi:hypothetical protein
MGIDGSATVSVADVALATQGFSRFALIASETLALQSRTLALQS